MDYDRGLPESLVRTVSIRGEHPNQAPLRRAPCRCIFASAAVHGRVAADSRKVLKFTGPVVYSVVICLCGFIRDHGRIFAAQGSLSLVFTPHTGHTLIRPETCPVTSASKGYHQCLGLGVRVSSTNASNGPEAD